MTSSFMALEFKAEHNLFACVEQEAYKQPQAAGNHPQKEEIISAHNWLRLFHPGFWASAEDDRTLVVLHRLSKELADYRHYSGWGGIDVVFAHNFNECRHDTFDKIAEHFLPNARRRLCTELLKVFPLYLYCKHYIIGGGFRIPLNNDPVEMRIGYRLDELDRTVNLYFKMVETKHRVPDPAFSLQPILDRYRLPDYIIRWWDRMDVEGMVRRGERVLKENPFNEYKGDYYRVPSFPLIEHGITKAEIVKYWNGKPEYQFPPVSNCVMCFHHTIRQLQSQWHNIYNQAKMEWASDAEKNLGKTFLRHFSMDDIKRLPIQTELEFSDFTGCDSGSCTD